MAGFANVAPYLTNPLTLIGFVLLLFFGLYRALIRSKIIPAINPADAPPVIVAVLRYGFYIAVSVIIAGFALAIINAFFDPHLRRSQAINELLHDVDVAQDGSAAGLALDALHNYTDQAIDKAYVTSKLKAILHTMSDGSDGSARDKKGALITFLKSEYNGNLAGIFASNFAEKMDLGYADLSNSDLHGVDFDGAFMLHADVSGANLRSASLDGTWVANVRVLGADFSGSSIEDADWFNMIGISGQQLGQVKPGTVMACPEMNGSRSEVAFIDYIRKFYAFGFFNWNTTDQVTLKKQWLELLKEGGVCSIADQLRNEGIKGAASK